MIVRDSLDLHGFLAACHAEESTDLLFGKRFKVLTFAENADGYIVFGQFGLSSTRPHRFDSMFDQGIST